MLRRVCERVQGDLTDRRCDGAATFVDGRAPGVAKTLGAAGGRSVVEGVRDAYPGSLPRNARGWCGAVHVDPTATWVTVAGGLDFPPAQAARSGRAPQKQQQRTTAADGGGAGWLATLHAPTAAVARGGRTPAAVRCCATHESTLITGGDEPVVSFWSLRDAAQAECKPRRTQRVDLPAVYALCVADDLPGLLHGCGIVDDDDLGKAGVLFTAGAAPVVDVSSDETKLFNLTHA